MSPERPWVLTIGARIVGAEATREEAQALFDPRQGALAFVTNEATGERWMYRLRDKTWIDFSATKPRARPLRADIDG